MLDTSLFLSYARRGRNAWWQYLICIVAGLTAGLGCATLAVVWSAKLLRGSEGAAGAMVEGANPIDLLVTTGISFAAILAVFATVVYLVHGKTPRDIIGAWSWKTFGWGFAVWGMLSVLAALADWPLAPHGFTWTAGPGTMKLFLTACLALPVQTFAEEFMFRGYLTQGLLLAIKRPLPTAIISGMLFGSVHIPNGWPQAAGACALGIVASLIAMKTGGIALTYGLHLVNNLFGAVVVSSASDVFRGFPALLTQHSPQLDWWDVGIEIAALLVLAALLWRGSAPLTIAAEPQPGNAG